MKYVYKLMKKKVKARKLREGEREKEEQRLMFYIDLLTRKEKGGLKRLCE
jgi:uncharacterized protein (UPF0335 family)